MADRWLGLLALAIGILILFVWIPLDVDTGIFEKARRSVVLGDAFAPAVAAALVAVGGCLLLLESRPRLSRSVGRSTEQSASPSPGLAPDSSPGPTASLTLDNCSYLLATLFVIAISLLVMRYAGPVSVSLFGDDGASYRLLRDTAPWKYVGFVAGGVLLVAALISRVERRVRFRFLMIGLIAVLILIAVYDLPFDDLLLPPNGDV